MAASVPIGQALDQAREIEAWKETALLHHRNEQYYRGLVVKIGEMLGEAAYIADDGGRAEDVLCAKVPELVVALTAERDHYKRESELGATMLGVIVSGLGEKATTKAGASVQDVLDHVAALTAEVERRRIAHDRADGALADAATVPTGDLERGILALVDERDVLAAKRAWALAAMTAWADRARTAEADVKALAEALTDIRDFAKGRAPMYEVLVRAEADLALPGVGRVREEGKG